MKKILFIFFGIMAIAWLFPTAVRADFPVAYTGAIEQKPAVAYNSQTGKFLVAYAIQYDYLGSKYYHVQCQLHNADGSKNGPVLKPFGDQGAVNGLGRPAIAYNKNQNIFFVAVAERLSTHDRVIGRFLNGDGTNRVGPDTLFDNSGPSPYYIDGFGTGSLHVVYNELLDEFLVTVQRVISHVHTGVPQRCNTVAAQRISESFISSIVELTDFGLNGLDSHAIAYAPVEGTTPVGGRYLFVAGRGKPFVHLLDSQLNLINYVPVKWGTPDGNARDHDIAYGEVEGQGMFLIVFTDADNCEPPLSSCPDPNYDDQWRGVWGTYVDPLVTSYPSPPGDKSFPISYVWYHTMTGVWPIQGPRVSYSNDAQGFFIVWREVPGIAPQNDEIRSHIRGAFVDYYLDFPTTAYVPDNVIISDITGPICTTGYYCLSAEDPEFPSVAAMSGSVAAVVWHQKYPPYPADFDIKGDLFNSLPIGLVTNPSNNHLYKSIDCTSWQDCENKAVAEGAHLVTIRNQGEQDWLVQTFGRGFYYWIGLTDKVTEGNFKWISGETLTYTNWSPGEPNNWGGVEHYVLMNWGGLGLWNDAYLSSTDVTKGIIEKSVTPPPPSASARVEIDHTYRGDLVVTVGVGNVSSPAWSTVVSNRAGGSADNLYVDVDISAGAAYLPPSSTNVWFLKVTDAAAGDTGTIKTFRITSGGQTYTSTNPPVAVPDNQTVYAYIGGTAPPPPSASARVEIDHTYRGDLVVTVGVGNVSSPAWSTVVSNRAGGSADNLYVDVDISAGAAYLPPSSTNVWFLKVTDAAAGDTGTIKTFRITSGGQTYTSTNPPVAVPDNQTVYAYIGGTAPPPPSASARVEIDHTYRGDLVVTVGVGNVNSPSWSTVVSNRAGGSADNLYVDVDISAGAAYLPPSSTNVWFLKVTDAAAGDTGTIKTFRITSGGQTYTSTNPPVAVPDNQTVYAYIGGTAPPGSNVTLESTYSTDVNNSGVKFYHDGNDWVGRSSSGILRAANRWDISGINPSWNITSVEVRFYVESKAGSTGALSINRYGSSHGEDNPQTDTGAQVYSKSAGSIYASLPEPTSGSWTNWVNLGSIAASDIEWCRTGGKSTWSVGLKASSTVESSATENHIDFSEDNETNDAELRITYTQ